MLAVAQNCVAGSSCSGTASGRILAGAAEVDITPQAWPLPRIGSFRHRPATSAHDPLRSRALVLGDGASTVAIALVDSCYIPREVVDLAKRLVHGDADLEADRVLVPATHTHSTLAPATDVGLRGLETEPRVENERI